MSHDSREIFVRASPDSRETFVRVSHDVRANFNQFYFSQLSLEMVLFTGVIQKVLPVLSTETLLHIWLSTEFYGFRPSSTAVDTWDTRGLMMSKLIFLAYFVILLSEFVSGIFFFLAKSVGKLLCRRFSYEEHVQAKMQK